MAEQGDLVARAAELGRATDTHTSSPFSTTQERRSEAMPRQPAHGDQWDVTDIGGEAQGFGESAVVGVPRTERCGVMGPMTHASVPVGGRPVALITAAGAPLLAWPSFAGGDPGPIVAALAQVPEMLEVAVPFLGVELPTSPEVLVRLAAAGMAS